MQNLNKTLQQLQEAYQPSGEHRQMPNAGAKNSAPVCSPETEDVMITLWDKMGQLFGAKWLRQYGDTDEPAFDTWCQFLADIRPDQIKQGFVNMLRDKPQYLPDAVQFRDYCLDLSGQGIPPAETAYEEACLAPSPKARQRWSHPIVYRAGVLTGWSDLHALPRDMALPRFKRNYEILCRRVAAGEDINLEIPEAIPERVSRVLPPEEAEVQIKSLREQVGI